MCKTTLVLLHRTLPIYVFNIILNNVLKTKTLVNTLEKDETKNLYKCELYAMNGNCTYSSDTGINSYVYPKVAKFLGI